MAAGAMQRKAQPADEAFRMLIRQNTRGSAILESTVVLVALVAILLGVMEWGRLTLANSFVAHAACEAARYASVHGATSEHPASAGDLTSLVATQAFVLDRSDLTVIPAWTPSSAPGSTVRVTVQYKFRPIVPWMPAGELMLQSSSELVVLR